MWSIEELKRLKEMTPEELYKYSWKGMETVEYVHFRTKEVVQCAVLAIDFDCHTFRLVPLKNLGYEEKEFWTSREFVRKIVKNQKLTLSKK